MWQVNWFHLCAPASHLLKVYKDGFPLEEQGSVLACCFWVAERRLKLSIWWQLLAKSSCKGYSAQRFSFLSVASNAAHHRGCCADCILWRCSAWWCLAITRARRLSNSFSSPPKLHAQVLQFCALFSATVFFSLYHYFVLHWLLPLLVLFWVAAPPSCNHYGAAGRHLPSHSAVWVGAFGL